MKQARTFKYVETIGSLRRVKVNLLRLNRTLILEEKDNNKVEKMLKAIDKLDDDLSLNYRDLK